MTILNVTFKGRSADYPLDGATHLSDGEVRRVALELVRSGTFPAIADPDLPEHAFDGYVVDRLPGGNGQVRLYLRPRVPFG